VDTSLSHKLSQQDLLFIKELFKVDKLKSVFDKEYDLKRTPEAMKYYAKGRTVRKIIIRI